MKEGFWSKDWFTGLAYTIVFCIAAFLVYPASFQGLERYAYDVGVRLNTRPPSDQVAVIAIDEASLQNLGRWPWPRDLHADMIAKLARGGAKVIGNTILYSEAQTDPGLEYVNQILGQFSSSSLPSKVIDETRAIERLLGEITALPNQGVVAAKLDELMRLFSGSALKTQMPLELGQIARTLFSAQRALQTDNKLAAAYKKAGNVVQAYTFTPGYPRGRPDNALPRHIERNRLNRVTDNVGAKAGNIMPFPTVASTPSIALIGNQARAHGHLMTWPDVDGALRVEPLVMEHYGEFYPSLSLMVAAAALNLEPSDIELRLGEGVTLGGLAIDTTESLQMYSHFYGPRSDGSPAFDVDSFFDVFVENIPAEKYRGKIVLLGASALGIGDRFATPVASAEAPVVALAHIVSSILGEDFYTRPTWALLAEPLILLVLALYLILLLPRLNAGIAAAISGGLIIALVSANVALIATSALWVQFMVPATFLLLGHIVVTVKTLGVTERLRASSELESAESNKMLGLAFQGQGQLDMAFDKFRKCPVDEGVCEALYGLAQDYERKRQFNKASAAYEYILENAGDFRDAKARNARAKKLADTVSLGGNVGAGTLLMSGEDMEKPMLGRYQVERELGKGAMGVVYLGRDPKIGRTVAIKTMALSQEFEAEELEDVKARFFREAETAGRLSHPHIVTIFDAGEEHDLAYIAMEFIEGYDLTRHIKPDTLLSIPEVLKIVADSADALDYAHQRNIVHRDIKPANLMWLTAEQIVKVTDFGIARLTDSSKTKTGMVLGTPSYMSPEQLAGRKVDGRSDLFSLGVTLFQMLTGQLPFRAESMATLMFKIANEQQARPSTMRTGLDARIDDVVEKSMQKDVEKRYQSGSDMARDLRALIS